MSSTVLEIKLKNQSKTYLPGNKVTGTVVIRSTTTMKVIMHLNLDLPNNICTS